MNEKYIRKKTNKLIALRFQVGDGVLVSYMKCSWLIGVESCWRFPL